MNGSKIVKVGFTDTHLLAYLNDGRIVSTPLEWYPTLQKQSLHDLNGYSLIGRGIGVEWERFDYQLSLEGMLKGVPEAGVKESHLV